jgi:hypothetical protein
MTPDGGPMAKITITAIRGLTNSEKRNHLIPLLFLWFAYTPTKIERKI